MHTYAFIAFSLHIFCCEILDVILLRMIYRHNDVNMWQSFWWHPMYLFCCTGNDTKLEFENMIVTQVEIELFFMSKLGRSYKKLRRIRNGIFKCHHFNIYTEASLMFYNFWRNLKIKSTFYVCVVFHINKVLLINRVPKPLYFWTCQSQVSSLSSTYKVNQTPDWENDNLWYVNARKYILSAILVNFFT